VSNAALSTVQQIITVLLALLGVIVALRPPRKGTWKEFGAIGVFLILGGIGVYATYAQGERLDAASTQQKVQLDAIQKNTEQVPKVVVENKIDPQIISNAVQQGLRQPGQTKGESNERLVKDKTFALATDILTFSRERKKGRPKIEMFIKNEKGELHGNPHLDEDFKNYNEYEKDTVRFFQDRYWQKAITIFVELKLSGFNAESVWFQPTDTEQIEDFGIGLANVAEKAPTH
jgi:hypothetical protein